MYANREVRLSQGLKPTMYGLQPGDKLEVSYSLKGRLRRYRCTVVKEYENYITVDKGNYKGSVDKLSILQGEIQVVRLH
jgi:hypothetical protein